MSGANSRRGSTAPYFQASHAGGVPAPPPLPAPRPLQRFRDAASSFFGHSSRPNSPPSGPVSPGFLPGGLSRRATLGATQNATASHKTGLAINTIAINEKGTHALLGGKEIFKTLKVEDGTCAEEVNLRSAIRSTPTQASGKTRQIYSIDIADVAWAKGDCGNYVAAATSSGKIVLYDIGHAGIQAAQLHEHARQVHKVTFNPHRGSLLLSGSQDGTVRLWDVRDVRQAQSTHSLPSKRKFSGQSDGVRDVKWSPTDGVDFAFGTDSGWIQRWDIRNLQQPKARIPAHTLAINSIDWHPDGKHIASGSLDKTVRVWDFSGKRQQKAALEVRTPYPVFNARWRPACDGGDMWHCVHLATSYDPLNPTMHIWDLRRPSLPFRELQPNPTAPTDFIWHSQDLLWTVGREGLFLQNDVQHATKVISRRNLSTVDVSPLGEMSFVTQKRRPDHASNERRRSGTEPISKHAMRIEKQSSALSNGSLPNMDLQDQNLLSRSWQDDSIDDEFLASTPPSQRQSKATATSQFQPKPPKSRTQSISMSKPAGQEIEALDVTMAAGGRTSLPKQQMWMGPTPLQVPAEVWCFLATNYKIDFSDAEAADDFIGAYESILMHNSLVAAAAGLYRLAQEWKILAFSIVCHLEKRMRTLSAREKPTNLRSFDAVRASISIDVEQDAPFGIAELLNRLVDYHTGADGSGKGDAQICCTMLLLLRPVLPQTHSLSTAKADRTVDYFVLAYEDAGFLPVETETIIDNHIQPLLRASVQPMQVEGLLCSYHNQLVTHKMFGKAAELRRMAYPAFPAVYEDHVGDRSSIRIACGACGAEMLQEREKRRCRDCSMKATGCAICWLEKSPFASEAAAERTLLWSACLRCAHTAHASCLRMFWALPESLGACPTSGCSCTCTREPELPRKKQDKVKRDDFTAGTSKAVDEAVGALSLREKG